MRSLAFAEELRAPRARRGVRLRRHTVPWAAAQIAGAGLRSSRRCGLPTSTWSWSSGCSSMRWCSTRTTCRREVFSAVRRPGCPRWRSWMASCGVLEADVLVDQNLAAELDQPVLPEGAVRLAGLDYVLIRDEMLALRPVRAAVHRGRSPYRRCLRSSVGRMPSAPARTSYRPWRRQVCLLTRQWSLPTPSSPRRSRCAADSGSAGQGDRPDDRSLARSAGVRPDHQRLRYVDLGAAVPRRDRRAGVRRGQPGDGLRASSRPPVRPQASACSPSSKADPTAAAAVLEAAAHRCARARPLGRRRVEARRRSGAESASPTRYFTLIS